MAIYQIAFTGDVGEPYIHACYQYEGDSPLILAGEKIFFKLENAMNGIEKSSKQLTVMPLVVRLLQEVYNAFDESIGDEQGQEAKIMKGPEEPTKD